MCQCNYDCKWQLLRKQITTIYLFFHMSFPSLSHPSLSSLLSDVLKAFRVSGCAIKYYHFIALEHLCPHHHHHSVEEKKQKKETISKMYGRKRKRRGEGVRWWRNASIGRFIFLSLLFGDKWHNFSRLFALIALEIESDLTTICINYHEAADAMVYLQHHLHITVVECFA